MRIGTPEVIAAIINALKNIELDENLREFAALALGDVKSNETIKALGNALGSEQGVWRQTVAQGWPDV